MKKIYNKLVRDNIPKIIEESGKRCLTETLDENEYIVALDRKLDEELAEYHSAPCAEELADLLEVIYSVAVARGITIKELERVRINKATLRGSFDDRILLKEVDGD